MKLYRVQAKYKNIYVDEMLEAKNDTAALEDFVKKVDSGDVTEKPGAGFEDPNFLFLTFEEVDRNVSTGTSGEKLQLESKWATQALSQGRVTTDMKWIDIELKDVKVKINEQSVIDAKTDLLKKAG